jgi:hypothetical protein
MREIARTIARRRFIGEITIERCEACDFSPVPIEAIATFEQTIAARIALFGPVDGETFRCLRISLGLDVEDVARLVNVALARVIRWERKLVRVDLTAWFVLADLVRERTARALQPIELENEHALVA